MDLRPARGRSVLPSHSRTVKQGLLQGKGFQGDLLPAFANNQPAVIHQSLHGCGALIGANLVSLCSCSHPLNARPETVARRVYVHSTPSKQISYLGGGLPVRNAVHTGIIGGMSLALFSTRFRARVYTCLSEI